MAELEDYQTPLRVRPMREEDIPAVIALQSLCFPGMATWRPEDLKRHLQMFAEGQIVVELGGGIVASSSSLRIDLDDYDEAHSFRDITAGGSIGNHDLEGRHLYGIEVMVHPDHRDKRLGRRLYEARKDLCRSLNLESILIAGRMPGYGAVADTMTPRQYVDAVQDGDLWDPVIGFQTRNGFTVRRILKDYLPGDSESRGYAALMEWRNLDHVPSGVHTYTSRPVRVSVIQYQMRRIAGFEDFAKQTEFFVSVAADHKSAFAVFPELITTQLLSSIPQKEGVQAAREMARRTDDYIAHFRDLAVRYDVNIVGGTHLTEVAGRIEHVAYLFRRDGQIGTQSKLHVTQAERRWWGVKPGNSLHVLETDSGKVAMLPGYDIEFPELARLAVARGARILFVPYNTEDRQGHLRVRYCAQARAVENQVYVVTAGTVGNLPEAGNLDIQYAQSGIYTPSDFNFPRDGIAGETDPNVEMVVVGDLDLMFLKKARRNGTVTNWHDRRTDLYSVVEPTKAIE